MNEPKLIIDMIPRTSWWDNARSNLSKAVWDRLRKGQYKAAGNKCEVCGQSGLDQGARWPVECHEIWEYDETTGIQRLVRLIALCPRCHHVKHWGRTGMIGGKYLQDAFVHLMMVNEWTPEEAKAHIRDASDTWMLRSQHPWKIDISILTRA